MTFVVGFERVMRRSSSSRDMRERLRDLLWSCTREDED